MVGYECIKGNKNNRLFFWLAIQAVIYLQFIILCLRDSFISASKQLVSKQCLLYLYSIHCAWCVQQCLVQCSTQPRTQGLSLGGCARLGIMQWCVRYNNAKQSNKFVNAVCPFAPQTGPKLFRLSTLRVVSERSIISIRHTFTIILDGKNVFFPLWCKDRAFINCCFGIVPVNFRAKICEQFR